MTSIRLGGQEDGTCRKSSIRKLHLWLTAIFQSKKEVNQPETPINDAEGTRPLSYIERGLNSWDTDMNNTPMQGSATNMKKTRILRICT